MATVAVFHSVLGVRPGVLDARRRLQAAGHDVHVVDQYDGRVFGDYETAGAFAEGVGYPALMSRALEAVRDLPDDLVCLGFSNGGGMAEYVACRRPVRAVVLCSGALPLELIGEPAWPAGVPAQIHYSEQDPFRRPGVAERVAATVEDAGARVEFFEYPGGGHLFTDPGLPAEYDAVAAELLWQRALTFVDGAGTT